MPTARSEISFNTRLALLATCIALIIALQLPVIQRTFSAALSPSTLSTNTTLGWERDPQHPRYRLFTALLSYVDYKDKSKEQLHRKLQGYKRLTPWSKKLMRPVNYTGKLNRAVECIDTNDLLVQSILTHGLDHYNITFPELTAFRRHNPPAEHTQTIQTLKHFIRDWSAAGAHERTPTFPPILHTLGDITGEKILVPGAGLGRLAYELAERGADVTVNEFSYLQLLALRWMLGHGHAGADAYTLHSNVDWWSHQARTASLLSSKTFPDVLPQREVTRRMRIVEGDFVSVFDGEEGSYDTIVTLFFIDTAKDVVEYIDTIWTLLRPGGRWVNLGPLLWGTRPRVELTLEEVLLVSEEAGFEFEDLEEGWGEDTFEEGERWRGKVRGALAGYSWERESLYRNAYMAQFWVARKGEGNGR